MRAASAIGWGVKSDGGRVAVGPGGAVLIPLGCGAGRWGGSRS
jgi:hypothetical protein